MRVGYTRNAKKKNQIRLTYKNVGGGKVGPASRYVKTTAADAAAGISRQPVVVTQKEKEHQERLKTTRAARAARRNEMKGMDVEKRKLVFLKEDNEQEEEKIPIEESTVNIPIEIIKESAPVIGAPSVVREISKNPIDYLKKICEDNPIGPEEIDDLIKDKHALDNQHDFTADRGDFVPNTVFIYYINDLFNKSATEANLDIDLTGKPANAIIDRNVKLQQRNIRFANLEWDTFNYFSRKLSNTFSCTEAVGLVHEEIAIRDLMNNSAEPTAKFNEFKSKKHIVLNSAEWDPTDDGNIPAMTLLGQFYLEMLGFNKEDNIYLNFDAKTKGTFTKPLRLYNNVKQIITYQNMFDSGTNMFSILSDNTKEFDRTDIVKSYDALDIITSNYFSQKITGRKYNMSYLHNQAYDDATSAVAIQNIFGWAKMDISGGTSPIASQYLLETNAGTTEKNNLPQRGGPGVGVLANYIERYRDKCKSQPINSNAKKNNCKKELNVIEQQKGFDTVRISNLVGDAYTFSDVIKLCVDIKGGGDAEQVNAMWYFYHHRKKSCIMITGDILCYMYSIIMGLPSVLIIGNKIYLSKGVPKEPPTQKEIYKNKINSSLSIFTGIVKTCTDIINTTGNMDKLIYNIKDSIFNKKLIITFAGETPDSDTQNLVNALIQIKALDIVNYLETIKRIITPEITEIKKSIDAIKMDHALVDDLYTKIFALDTHIVEEDEAKLKVIIDTINSSMIKIKNKFQDFNKLLGNFKNKKYVTDIQSFINGFTSLEFYTAKTTIKTYELFNYDRDAIFNNFAGLIKKIKNERAIIGEKNPRNFLGKQIRSKFQDFIKSLFSINMLDIGLDAGYLKDLLEGYNPKVQDVKETAFYKNIELIISDANITIDRKPSIANDLLTKLNAEIIKIGTVLSISEGVVAAEASATFGGNAVIKEIATSVREIIQLTREVLLYCKNNNINISINATDYKPLVDNELSTDILIARAKSRIEDVFREILQDSFFINLAKLIGNLEEYIYSSYDILFNKWNDLRYNLENNKETYSLLEDMYEFDDVMMLPEMNSYDNKLKIIQGLAKHYTNATFNQDDKIKVINDIGKDIFIEEEDGYLSEEEDGLGIMVKAKPKVYDPYAGLLTPMYEGLGGKRSKTSKNSYGENNLTKMLKGMKLGKSKKQKYKQRKTIKKQT